MIELVAFLGNPGPEHAGNRHNAGWLLAEKLAFAGRLNWRKKFKGLWADIEGPSLGNAGAADGTGIVNAAGSNAAGAESVPQKIHFLLPETYMNQSGDSVFQAASFFKIKPEQILVVHDELELAAGTISLKFGGGLGGHNGLRSMKANFGTPDFWRLRIGIGRPDSRLPGQGGKEGSGRGIVEWVLSDFGAEELAVLEPALEAAAGLLQNALAGGPEKFLPLWAKRNVSALLRAAQ